MSLPWNERVTSFQVNPESATIADIVRMAEELTEKKEPEKPLNDPFKYPYHLEPPTDAREEWKVSSSYVTEWEREEQK